MGSANGLSARPVARVSIGSTLSHQRHRSSVLPFALETGTNLFSQCKQRVNLYIACTSGSAFLRFHPNVGTNFCSLHCELHVCSRKGEERIYRKISQTEGLRCRMAEPIFG